MVSLLRDEDAQKKGIVDVIYAVDLPERKSYLLADSIGKGSKFSKSVNDELFSREEFYIVCWMCRRSQITRCYPLPSPLIDSAQWTNEWMMFQISYLRQVSSVSICLAAFLPQCCFIPTAPLDHPAGNPQGRASSVPASLRYSSWGPLHSSYIWTWRCWSTGRCWWELSRRSTNCFYWKYKSPCPRGATALGHQWAKHHSVPEQVWRTCGTRSSISGEYIILPT